MHWYCHTGWAVFRPTESQWLSPSWWSLCDLWARPSSLLYTYSRHTQVLWWPSFIILYLSTVIIYRNRAIHGDLVTVKLFPQLKQQNDTLPLEMNKRPNKLMSDSVLPTGEVVGILERKKRDYVASFDVSRECCDKTIRVFFPHRNWVRGTNMGRAGKY